MRCFRMLPGIQFELCEDDSTASLLNLCAALEATRVKEGAEARLLVLIDEYDHCANVLLQTIGYDSDKLRALKEFYQCLKDLRSLTDDLELDDLRTVTFGNSPLPMNDLKLNLVEDVNASQQFSTALGLSVSDVQKALGALDIASRSDSILALLSAYFGGYSFVGTASSSGRLFNPQLITRFCYNLKHDNAFRETVCTNWCDWTPETVRYFISNADSNVLVLPRESMDDLTVPGTVELLEAPLEFDPDVNEVLTNTVPIPVPTGSTDKDEDGPNPNRKEPLTRVKWETGLKGLPPDLDIRVNRQYLLWYLYFQYSQRIFLSSLDIQRTSF
jgi:hypothetical protein